MKKLATLLLAAAMMMGASTAAQAIDVKVSGQMDFALGWGDTSFKKASPKNYNNNSGTFTSLQRVRTQIDFIASESLSGTLQFEIGDTIWGKSTSESGRSQGGAIGADGVTIEVKRAYIDWMIPNTDAKVRVGIQGFDNPSYTGMNSAVMASNAEVGGISVNYQITPEVGVSAWWFRPFADNDATTDNDRTWEDMDVFGISIPLTFDGIKITPWGMYAAIGRDSLDDTANAGNGFTKNANTQLLPAWLTGSDLIASSDGQGSAYWLAIAGSLNFGTPLTIAFDALWGSADMGDDGTYDFERSGFLITAIVKYKLDNMTPAIFGWYGTGDDDDPYDGSEVIPAISAQAKLSSFGMDGGFGITQGAVMGESIITAGTWAIGAQITDISYIDDLKHTVRFIYYGGTNDSAMAEFVGTPFAKSGSGFYLTDEDYAIEINLNTYYNIYKNLQLALELGYIYLDIDDGTWGDVADTIEENGYKIGIGLRYSF